MSKENKVEKIKSVTKEEIKVLLDEISKETEKPVMRLILTNEKPSLTESKFGGIPYLPHEMEVPRDAEGNQLRLLAQIDCTKLKDLKDFPHAGILQFWISQSELYGLDFDSDIDDFENCKGYRVIYYEEIDDTVTKEEVSSKIEKILLDEDGYDCFPIDDEYSLQFSLEKEGMTWFDYRYENIFIERYNKLFSQNIKSLFDLDDDIYDILANENEKDNQHKMNGYPFFTQGDPREIKNECYDTLLLQIDSEFDNNNDYCEKIMWGDSGVCNFFINKDDLKKRNFQKILYNWDCC